MRFLNGLQPLALLALRVCLGVIMVYHGYPKLVHVNAGMGEFFVTHGLPSYLVPVAGILEAFGGVLLVLGLFTRPAALLLAIEMGVAIWKVHSGHGYLAVKEYEFPLAVGAACFALATVGAGAASLDYLIFGDSGTKRRAAKSGKE